MRAAAAAALALWWAAWAHAAPFVLASQRLEVDAERGRVRAWDVRLTDGRRVVTAPELVLDRPAGVGTLSGGVRATGPEGELRSRAAQVRFTPQLELVAVEAFGAAQLLSHRGRLVADRVELDLRAGVASARGSPAQLVADDVTATSGRVVYRTREQTAVLEGPARFEAEGAALQGRQAAFDLRGQTATVQGPVAFRFPQGRGAAQQARADFRAGRVDLEGPVRARWRGSVLEGRRMVVWYREGRLVVEGPGRMTVPEEDLRQIP